MKSSLLTLLFLVSLVITLAFLGVGLHNIISQNTESSSGSEMIPALLVLAGVAGLLLIFVVGGIVFKIMGMADNTQAFGLPEGSIRAVVATMSLLLFGIVPLFLYATLLKQSDTKEIHKLQLTVATDLKAKLGESFVAMIPDTDSSGASITPSAPGSTTPSPPKTPTTGGASQPPINTQLATYTVLYRDPPSTAATDLAKQFFTALTTLVAAMSSFFFGSAVATSATKVGAKNARGADANAKLMDDNAAADAKAANAGAIAADTQDNAANTDVDGGDNSGSTEQTGQNETH